MAHSQQAWERRFQELLVRDCFEQFSMLMFDPKHASDQQARLLHDILFVDHTSMAYWYAYLSFLSSRFPSKQHSLTRLAYKALSVIPEPDNKSAPEFVKIHLSVAEWLASVSGASEARKRYLKMEKEGIGLRYADMYKQWAQLEKQQANDSAAKMIIEKGIAMNAEPRHVLIEILESLQSNFSQEPKGHESSYCSETTAARDTHLNIPDSQSGSPTPAKAVGSNHADVGAAIKQPDSLTNSSIAPKHKSRILRTSSNLSGAKRIKISEIDDEESTQLHSNKFTAAGSVVDEEEIVVSVPPMSSLADRRSRWSSDIANKSASSSTLVRRHTDTTPPSESIPRAVTMTIETALVPETEPRKVDVKALRNKYIDESIIGFNPLSRNTRPQSVVKELPTRKAARSNLLDRNVNMNSQQSTERCMQQSSNKQKRNISMETTPTRKQPCIDCRNTEDETAQGANSSHLDDYEVFQSKSNVKQIKQTQTKATSEPFPQKDEISGQKKHRVQDEATSPAAEESVNDTQVRRHVTFSENIGSTKNSKAEESSTQAPTSSAHAFCKIQIAQGSPQQTGDQGQIHSSSFHSLFCADQSRIVNVNDQSFFKLDVLGRGGSSCVYKVLTPDCKIFALKHVDMKGHDDIEKLAKLYENEIGVLRSLQGSPSIISLIDHQIDLRNMCVYVVMELGESDLLKVLKGQKVSKPTQSAGEQNYELSLNFIRLTWQQMLEAVEFMHFHRIVHGDLKPANFVFVCGKLKLIDFGIAKAINNNTTHIVRESQIGTINYMSPEALKPVIADEAGHIMKLGRQSDIWSLGCILFEMVYGRTPFYELHYLQKICAITDPTHSITYPPYPNHDVVDCMKLCLQRDPRRRPSIAPDATGTELCLLEHPFLHPSTSASESAAASSRQNMSPAMACECMEAIASKAAAGGFDDQTTMAKLYGFAQKLSHSLSPVLRPHKQSPLTKRAQDGPRASSASLRSRNPNPNRPPSSRVRVVGAGINEEELAVKRNGLRNVDNDHTRRFIKHATRTRPKELKDVLLDSLANMRTFICDENSTNVGNRSPEEDTFSEL